MPLFTVIILPSASLTVCRCIPVLILVCIPVSLTYRYDGVAYVNQCPIQVGTNFTYRFLVGALCLYATAVLCLRLPVCYGNGYNRVMAVCRSAVAVCAIVLWLCVRGSMAVHAIVLWLCMHLCCC